jgi:translation elongation factor EF-4
MNNFDPAFKVKPGELWISDIGLSIVIAQQDVSSQKIVNLFIDFEYGTVIIEVIHQRDLLLCDGKQLT